MNENLELLSQNNESTIIAKYIKTKRRDTSYQSEAKLEKDFIKQLQSQGYEYIDIKNESGLLENLKIHIGRLNGIVFSENEWDRFYKQVLCNPKLSRIDKTRMIQTIDETQILERDDGSIKNIVLLDREIISNNHLQVISQVEHEGVFKNRYDVSVLVNGLPLVHIELKKRGANLKEAFNQIERYARESFGAGNALFEYVQIFVISNGTNTKYCSNSTRDRASGQTSLNDHYEFCITFSDANNSPILDLEDFCATFFAKRTLCNILAKYCVFNAQNELLIMRPYQIAASERIIDKIKISHELKSYGSIQACGYIWHSTGSGKTLTSFKTALLASRLNFIKKVLFVVDRKDLDYQTMKEYDRFQKGAANSTNSTIELKAHIESNDIDKKIIITTIQKLSIFVEQYKNSAVFNWEIVFIFDECHRSQFGQMHESLIKHFKKYYIFGFTGTPIFELNANKNNITTINTKNIIGNDVKVATIKTTDVVFGTRLHSYTIVNAIRDKNVLPFRVEYISTMKQIEQEGQEEKIISIERTKALLHKDRIKNISSYILEHFNQKTKRIADETIQKQRDKGFNAIFATQSIEFAKAYYMELKKQIAQKPTNNELNIAIIYSYAPNEDIDIYEEDANNKDSKIFLANAINDYNAMFKENFSLNNFDSYYKDVSQKLKDRKLDLLIVVDMFLTGFDSKTINTLWVDKNLKHHGLLQSFSRTNRILNSVKTYGNIVCFRNLEKNTQESLTMFGDESVSSIVLLRSFEEYLNGYVDEYGEQRGYFSLVEELKEKFPLETFNLHTKEEEKNFIELFGKILRLENILNAFDDFEKENTLESRNKQDYQSYYIDIANKIKGENEKSDISDDINFEMELIKQTEVDVEYILNLLEQYYNKQDAKENELREKILRTVDSSVGLHSKKELIRAFLEEVDFNVTLDSQKDFEKYFEAFIQRKQKEDIEKLIKEHNLQEKGTKDFIHNSFIVGKLQILGTILDNVLPKVSIFSTNKDNKKEKDIQKTIAINQLQTHFERYKDIIKI